MLWCGWALNSGVMPASVIMGYDNLIDIGLGNNIITDLHQKAENDAKKKN